ncbi:MAG: phosphatidylglycerophosphatase A family protein [Burkholderiales bacterium]
MDSTTLAKALSGPSWRFVASHPAHVIALLGGVGLIRFAPGTFGTLGALPLHLWAAAHLNAYVHLAAIAALFAIGIWAAGRTSRDLGVADHGGIVWDETVAFLLVLFFTPPAAVWQAAAFALFRVFDIFKPPPIRHFDRTLHGGFGVMFDDLLAAGYSLLCLAAAKALLD